MFKKLLPLTLVALVGLAPNVAAKIDARAKAGIGTSSDSNNSFHAYIGATFSQKLGKGVSIGLDMSALLENTNSETSYGAKLEEEFKNYSLGITSGLSKIRLSKTLHISDSKISEPIPENTYFINAEIGRKISEKARIKAVYQKNFVSEEISNNNYPLHRVSLGLETLF